MESSISPKNKNRNNIYKNKTKGANCGSQKTLFYEMPIYWAAENFFAFQILQPVSVV
jgi:hypothetical protein